MKEALAGLKRANKNRVTGRALAEKAYEKVREICVGRFPGADAKLSHGMPSAHGARKDVRVHFVDNSHGGSAPIAVWCKSTFADQKRHIAENAARFFSPPYVGVKGWLGIDVHPKRADWIELAMIVEEAWAAVAPPKVVSGEAVAPKIPKKPAPVRVLTDEKIAKAALEKLSKICLALPGSFTRARVVACVVHGPQKTVLPFRQPSRRRHRLGVRERRQGREREAHQKRSENILCACVHVIAWLRGNSA